MATWRLVGGVALAASLASLLLYAALTGSSSASSSSFGAASSFPSTSFSSSASSSSSASCSGARSTPELAAFEAALAQQLATPFRGFTFRVPSAEAPLRRAYVALVIEDDAGHLCGARALMASLRRTNTTADIVAMIVPETSPPVRAYLTRIGYKVREVPRIRPNVDRDGYYASVFSSINLWSLTEYDCVVKLDTDMVVLTNIDELFLYNHFAATPDYPAGLPVDTDRCRETQICQHTSHDFRAQYLNGALLVVQPNVAVFDELRGVLNRHEEQLIGGPSEQGFLNWAFKDKWFSLPHYYNVRQPALRAFPQMFVVSPPRTFHFIGGMKPWKAEWDCGAYCQASPLELWHSALWYPYYNDPALGTEPASYPPRRSACHDHLTLKST